MISFFCIQYNTQHNIIRTVTRSIIRQLNNVSSIMSTVYSIISMIHIYHIFKFVHFLVELFFRRDNDAKHVAAGV